jgi:hypothetical protein
VAVSDLELSALVLDLAKQPRVLDGHRRLAREGPEDVNDRLGELAGRLPVHGEPTDEMPLAQQRNAQECPRSGLQEDVAQGTGIGPGRRDVGYLDRLACHRHASSNTFATSDRSVSCHRNDLFVEAVCGAEQKLLRVFVVFVDRA